MRFTHGQLWIESSTHSKNGFQANEYWLVVHNGGKCKTHLGVCSVPSWHNWWLHGLAGDKLVTSDPVITGFLQWKIACTTGDKLVIKFSNC